MSAKWRAIQHRHRYTYSSVIFPQYFIDALNQTPSLLFFSEVKQLASLNSIYSQVEHAKNVASSFSKLLLQPNADENTVLFASKFYVEILFLENSLPLHKTLVSVLAKAKYFQGLIKNCFRELCEEYRNGNGKAKGRRFSVSRAALTMMSTPKLGYLGEVVEECGVLVGWDVVSGLDAVVSEIREWSKPSPLVMEQCQEALSCMYYLFQRFPMKFVDMGEGPYASGSDVLRMVLMTMLSIFKSQAFSRDCFVAAGVSFCAALQVSLDADELGLFIMEGIFNQTSVASSKTKFKNLTRKIPYSGNLIYEISSFTALSRLCLIRGILTAVSRTVLNTHILPPRDGDPGSGDHTCVKRTILYDGILPELCNYCENPTDSHFNFHALTVMQICLQQIKTLMHSNSRDFVDIPFSEHIGSRILRIVWNNLEDPLSQTVKQVHLIFDLFLDIQASLYWVEGGEKNKLFLMDIAAQLLRLGPRCKGRYIPLASLTKRLGAKMILDLNPELLFETTNAYIDDDVCCAATTFLKCFLECLRDEYWSSNGIQNGYVKYRCECLPPFLCGLASGVTKLRSNMNTYALPVLLELDMDCIFPLLASIGVRLGEENAEWVYTDELHYAHISLELEQQIAVLVSLLKVSRLLALIEGDIDWCDNFPKSLQDAMSNSGTGDFYSLICIKGIKVRIPVKWLVLALIHTDDSLRIDAAEFLLLNPKTASLPSFLELSLMREAVPLNMRCCSTAFQMKWTSLFRKFFARVKTALERQYKQGTFHPIAAKATKEIMAKSETEGTLVNLAEYLFNLMKWLNCFLFYSCYPSAPYERKIMAMELMLIMLNVWSTLPPSIGNSDAISTETCLFPYNKGFMLPDSTLLLVGSIVDSWDRLRLGSFHILLHFPTPLPGIDTPDKVQEAIMWAKKLVCSPRVRESDAGALTLRLIFRKYVVEVGWMVNLSLNVVSYHLPAKLSNGESHVYSYHSPVVEYISSLIDWLQVSVENGEKDLSEACRNSFVHGVLLTLRYTFEELNWNCKAIMSNIAEMKLALVRLLDLVLRIAFLALWVVSADAWYLPEDMEEMAGDDEVLPLEDPGKEVLPPSEVGNEEETPKITLDVRTSEQIVMVGCWLAMKEVSLLLGTIIRKIPLPTSDVSESRALDDNGNNICKTSSEGMLDLKQLEMIGNHFLEVLLKMKHNGAIDKTRAGFTALCNRLLCSNDARLCKLTESWMEQLMDRMVAKGQTVDDLLRRSAGIPAAFTAFFLSEPEGSPKRLLPKALRWLIDVANMSLIEQNKKPNTNNGSAGALRTKSNQVTGSSVITGVQETDKMSKIRDDGVIPTVHAFNVLRTAFNDTNLATDTSGFAAEALILSIRAFSSSYWEVRNSACLAYTALVRRMIGFLNVQKRESARRALTGLEFFHRYPSLHSFLFHELKVATELLLDESSRDLGSNLAKVVHPSLCPMLILLSRLKPSAITSETGDAQDPYSFLPFIRRCSVQSNFRIRVLASRAISGLISNEKLPVVLFNIASELPCAEDKIMNSDIALNTKYSTSSTFNSIHGILLQLSSLLDTNCRNLADFYKRDKVLNDLIQILLKCSWIGMPRQCPCPILNSCFLNVLDNMLSIARTCERSSSTDSIRNLVWSLSSECLDLETLQRTSYYDPTRAELRKQAAISYFNSIFQTSKEFAEENPLTSRTCPQPSSNLLEAIDSGFALSSFQERLIRCISDPSYEVRLATLKWLLLFLHMSASRNYDIRSHCLNNFDLQTTLIEGLAAEKHHKCMNYILKVLYSWNSLECEESNKLHAKHRSVANMDCDSLCQFWDMLVSLFKVARHLKIRQALLCCMGICIKRFSGLFLRLLCLDIGKEKTVVSSESDCHRRLSYFESCISYFVHLLELHSDPSEPVNMRKAAAESVVASGLLEQAILVGASISNRRIPDETPCSDLKIDDIVYQHGHKILDLWFTCVKLMEDEDVGIRSKLAFDVQKCVTRVCGDELPVGMVPTQVEKVIQLSIQHLSSAFGHWIDFFDYLCHWILSATDSATSIVSRGDIVRRVFDKEIDNHHEEKLLICQLCCSNLEKLPISKYWIDESTGRHNVMEFLRKWRRRFCQRLISFADDHVGQQGGVDWIGGVGNHKDAFLPLYANLLGFFTLSNCIFREELENPKSMLREVSEIGKSIHPFLRNPLISSLYFLAVDVHEKMLGEKNTSHLTPNLERIDSGWDFYEPYFLLG